jgi:hypothetical protein
MTTDPLVDFQNQIRGAHLKVPFARRLHACLTYATTPNNILRIGIAETGDGSVFINSRRLAQFLGLRANSLNRNLRDHGFRREQSTRAVQELSQHLPYAGVEGGWWKWRPPVVSFDRFSLASDLEKLSNHARAVRAGDGIQPLRYTVPIVVAMREIE